MEELEDMMFMEAVRLSLAAEEDRARKQEKVERKEAKKRLKEERKAAKKAEKQGSIYGGGSSATSSSLSLGLGRRRGNSTTSNLRMEAAMQNAQSTSTPKTSGTTSPAASSANAPDKGKGVERTNSETEPTETTSQAGSSTTPSLPIPAPGRGPSHLRQMSNASSISSSLADSAAGSFTNPGHLDSTDPRASGTSLNHNDEADRDANEPMFNFRSLAEMVGVDLENGEAVDNEEGRKNGAAKKGDDDEPEAEHAEDVRPAKPVQESVATLVPPVIHEVPEEHGDNSSIDVTPNSDLSTPQLMITPETPAPLEDNGESKQLGGHSVLERSPAFTH